MNKVISFLCIAALIICSLTACSDTASQGTAQSGTDYSGQTLTGKIVAVDGTLVAIQLGELSGGTDGATSEMPEGDTDGAAPEMPEGDADSAAPEMPEGDADSAAPEMPDGDADSAAPEMPEGGTDSAAPEMPEGGTDSAAPEMPEGGADGAAPEMPEGQQDGGMMQTPGGQMESSDAFTANGETAILDISGATILLESASDSGDSSEGSMDDITVGAVTSIEVDSNNAVSTVTVLSAGGNSGTDGNKGNNGFGGSGEVTQGASANTIDTDGEYSDTVYSSTGDDENALRIDGAAVTLTGITVDKSAGSSSNTENGDFYGMNAALLATNGANVTIADATITSSAQNGNGVFSYGSGTIVNISDSAITTTADNSGGIQTTGGGTTNASNLTVETSGSSSAAIRSDRGGGTVSADGGTYTSNGYNSPAVYSTAAITVKNALLTASNSEALVIEGENSITLENCDVSGNMSSDKGTSSDENVHNVMIYQSMSGDANVGTSSFSMTGGSLLSNNGDMFYITNTACSIYLSDVEITNRDESAYLMNICGNSASHGWGTAGKNGAQVTFTADGQILEGDIAVDTISTLNMTLSGNSSFTGTVNIVDNAQNGAAASDNAVVTIESGSTWTLTGDCAITSLTNDGTINFNGFTITLADGTVLN